MADFGEKVPDARPGVGAPDAAGDPEAMPDAVPPEADQADPADLADAADAADAGPPEADRHRRLIAARLIVAGVGLTFLIVGFVQFITK